jgi:hypothetical protein
LKSAEPRQLAFVFADSPQGDKGRGPQDESYGKRFLVHTAKGNGRIRSDAPDRQKQNAAVGGRKIVGEFSWSLASMSPAAGGKFAPVVDRGRQYRGVDARERRIDIGVATTARSGHPSQIVCGSEKQSKGTPCTPKRWPEDRLSPRRPG